MIRKILLLLAFACLFFTPATADDELVQVQLETSLGTVDLVLNKSKAPGTVENFLAYAEEGYYNRLIFHRVVPGRLIQGGGYTKRLYERARRDPIQNEADNGLKNLRGTIAMARNQDPHSAQSQFYINIKDNEELDHQGKELRLQWGYAVFGEVTSGLDVVEAIAAVPSAPQGQFDRHVPVDPVFIIDVRVVDADAVEAAE